MVVRYEGHLDIGHVYRDIKKRFLSQLKPCWRRVGIAKDSKGFSLREVMSSTCYLSAMKAFSILDMFRNSGHLSCTHMSDRHWLFEEVVY